MPVELVDEVIPVKPDSCRRRGHALTGDDPNPQRHQAVVIPPARARVIEYQRRALRCRHCDLLTEADWPDGVSRRAFGPSAQAWVGLLAGAYRMSKRNIARLLADAFGVRLSVGTVSCLEQEVSAAVAGPVEEACDFVRRQATVNVDETGWRERRTAATAGVTGFAIRKSRGRDGVEALLGPDSRAIVGPDRYSAYGHLPLERRQVCWAHLRRAFEEFGARGGEAAWAGQRLLAASDSMFKWWHRVRDGTLSRNDFQRHVQRLRGSVRWALCHGQQRADAKTLATCANLLDLEPALWTFAAREGVGVEPTNNEAERALRHGVLWRHTSFGTHSADGSRFVERLLTVSDTLRQQPAPSLLPPISSVVPS